jgi:hypothetical protein
MASYLQVGLWSACAVWNAAMSVALMNRHEIIAGVALLAACLLAGVVAAYHAYQITHPEPDKEKAPDREV